MTEPEASIQYDPFCFACDTIGDAKAVILTTENDLSSEERWITETNWTLPHLVFDDGLIVDYGCGIGRLAALLKQPVLGVDISPTMRAQADAYVNRAEFGAVNPKMFERLVDSGLRATGAIAVWSLQHILNPAYDIALLARVLVPGARLLVINDAEYRRVPARRRADGWFGWVTDSIKIEDLLDEGFSLLSTETVPRKVCGGDGYLRVYARRGNSSATAMII